MKALVLFLLLTALLRPNHLMATSHPRYFGSSSNVVVEKLRHQLQGLLRLRQLEVIPESVGQGFENHELCINAGA
jgi:hypothetical protein